MEIITVLNQYLLPASFAFILAMVLILIALKLFPKLGLLDQPRKYGLKRKPIPYYGGVVIFLAFLLSVFLFVPLTGTLYGLLLGSTMIVIVGFLDDLFDLKPWIRLFVQFLATLILVFSGIGLLSINMPFLGVIDLSRPIWNGFMVLSALFTVVWIITVLNVMNLIDGIPGLSSGVSFIAALTIFFLSIHPNLHEDPASQVGVATIAIILAMVALAFLIFDFPKPVILMGDTGSTFLGFVIASLAIFSGGKVATAFLVMGIPILDMIWVVLRRLFSGKKFWHGDLKHLHHRLLYIGFSKRKIVIMYLIITAFLGFSAVLLVSGQQKLFMIIALTVLMVLLATALVLIPNKK